MNSKEILKIAEAYFIDYFGTEYKSLIRQRLGNTDFNFVKEGTVDEITKEHLSKISAYISFNNLKPLKKESEQMITQNIKKISVQDGDRGRCFFTVGKNNSGEIVDVRRGAFVGDLNNTVYQNTQSDAFTDMVVCHELLHAVTQHIYNNRIESGIKSIHAGSEKLNEWVINSMALEVVKKMHSHGFRLNERITPSSAIHNDFRRAKLGKLPVSLFSNYKNVLKPAMVTGDFRELYDAFGNKEKFTEVCEYVNTL